MKKLSIQRKNPVNQRQILRLTKALHGGPVLITTHNNPDPDALAAGKAMQTLITGIAGVETSLIFNGVIGRAENQAMLNLLTPEWKAVEKWEEDPKKYSSVVFVDCQPGSRNIIPINSELSFVVFDHHNPITDEAQNAAYSDIRMNVGSTVTMIYQYLDAAQVEIDPVLATAMFYGLHSDTNGLSRGASADDGIVYVKLLEKLDKQLLLKIESAGLTQEFYQAFSRGFQNAKIYGKAITAYLGNMHRPDLASELADLLFRYESIYAVLCSGVFQNVLYFSIRTGLSDRDAGFLVQDVIFPPGKAGGHGIMAGGQIPLQDENANELVLKLEKRFLDMVGEPGIPKPLLYDTQE
jgi:nanoRNase/pAp phosphatase (c-di-AMP/oligoRNAs hydrolase)